MVPGKGFLEDEPTAFVDESMRESAEGLYVIAAVTIISKQERARAKCLERLLWDLEQLGVGQLIVESRGEAADRKDRRTILRAIKSGLAATDLVYENRKGPLDSALWLPDALAGAAATALTGQTRYRDRLSGALERTKVAL